MLATTYTTADRQYEIVRLSQESLPDVQYLFTLCFGFDPGYDQLYNKHVHCHGSEKFLGYIAYDLISKEAAAFYAVFPTFITVDSERILSAQSGDTMTNPKHQKRGLFIHLAELTYNLCRQSGIKLIYGFPNGNSHPGFINKLDFQDLPILEEYCFVENRFELNRLTKRNRFFASLHTKWIKFILYRFTHKSNEFQRTYFNQYSQVYIDQNYFDTKNGNYYWINSGRSSYWLKLNGNSLMIGDVANWSKEDLLQFKRKMKFVAFFAGIRFVTFSVSPNHPHVSLLKSLKVDPVQSKQHVIVRSLEENISYNELIFTGSDIDVY